MGAMNDKDPDAAARPPKRAVHPWFVLAERQSHVMARLWAVNAGYARYVAQLAGLVGRAALEQAEVVRKAAQGRIPTGQNSSPRPAALIMTPKTDSPVKPKVVRPRVVKPEVVKPEVVVEPEPVVEPEVVEPEPVVEPEVVEPEPVAVPAPPRAAKKAAPKATVKAKTRTTAKATAKDTAKAAAKPKGEDETQQARLDARNRYAGKRKADLVKEAGDRGLPTSGTIAALIQRLADDDPR